MGRLLFKSINCFIASGITCVEKTKTPKLCLIRRYQLGEHLYVCRNINKTYLPEIHFFLSVTSCIFCKTKLRKKSDIAKCYDNKTLKVKLKKVFWKKRHNPSQSSLFSQHYCIAVSYLGNILAMIRPYKPVQEILKFLYDL